MQRLQRLIERAFAIPVIGFALLTPPLLPLFGQPVTLLGVPLLLVYVFGVWLALILAGYFAARALQRAADREAETVTTPPRETGSRPEGR